MWLVILWAVWTIYWGKNILGSFWNEMAEGRKLMLLLTFPIIVSVNALWLIPAFLKKRRWLAYLTYLILVVSLLEFLRSGINALVAVKAGAGATFSEELLSGIADSGNLFPAVFLGLIVSFGYRFSADWIQHQTVIERLKAEKYSMELAFLKSQVDPHFLFNTLNSLYASALEEKSPNTADGIARLATLMRYNLHDAQADAIALSTEIAYILKYIELQQLRLTDRNRVSVHIPISEEESRSHRIAPMLLIPFIENAFKHGVNPAEDSEIRVDLTLNENVLLFKVDNTLLSNGQRSAYNGVGLPNVKNRLALLYPEKHQLTINREERRFTVELTIKLEA